MASNRKEKLLSVPASGELVPGRAGGHAKSNRYADRGARYAEARRRNRRSACREAGQELRSRVESLIKRSGEGHETFRKSA